MEKIFNLRRVGLGCSSCLKVFASIHNSGFTEESNVYDQRWALSVLGAVFRYYRKWIFAQNTKYCSLWKNTKYQKLGGTLRFFGILSLLKGLSTHFLKGFKAFEENTEYKIQIPQFSEKYRKLGRKVQNQYKIPQEIFRTTPTSGLYVVLTVSLAVVLLHRDDQQEEGQHHRPTARHLDCLHTTGEGVRRIFRPRSTGHRVTLCWPAQSFASFPSEHETIKICPDCNSTVDGPVKVIDGPVAVQKNFYSFGLRSWDVWVYVLQPGHIFLTPLSCFVSSQRRARSAFKTSRLADWRDWERKRERERETAAPCVWHCSFKLFAQFYLRSPKLDWKFLPSLLDTGVLAFLL